MRSMTKTTKAIWVWYAVCVLGIGAWALTTFRTFENDGTMSMNTSAFFIGAGVAAVLGFPFLVISWTLQRSHEAQETRREHDAQRFDSLQSTLDALVAANLATASVDEPSSNEPSSDSPEVTSVPTGVGSRSPYEPPHDF